MVLLVSIQGINNIMHDFTQEYKQPNTSGSATSDIKAPISAEVKPVAVSD